MTETLERILYVEDEPDIMEIAKLALVDIGGFDVKACPSGEVALEVASTFKPDLILLDVMMPGMDGPSTLQALRAESVCAKTPVIFMTAKVQADEVKALLELGAIDVIPKPFDPMSLAEQVRQIWSNL